MSLAAFGAVCFAAALVLMWRRRSWRRIQAVLMVVAGLAVSGAVGGLRDHISAWSQGASATGSQKLFGVAVPYILAGVVALLFYLEMDLDGLANKMRGRGRGGRGDDGPNRFRTTAWTPWLGLLLPVALAVLPGLGALPDHARDGIAQFAAMIH